MSPWLWARACSAWRGETASESEARSLLLENLATGKALEVFRNLIAAQGGNPGVCDDEALFERAAYSACAVAGAAGYITGMDAAGIGQQTVLLGAGRQTKEQPVDSGVGLILEHRIGDLVKKGDRLATVFARSADKAEACAGALGQLIRIGAESPESLPVILDWVI